jgi:hypothetical protein
MVLRLDMLHWKTNLPALADEHHAWKELWCYECSFPGRSPIHDPTKYAQSPEICGHLYISNNLSVFFLIMQFVPYDHSFVGSEYVVVPCVLCLMPFSCLWAGTISSANGQGCDEPTRKRHSTIDRGSSKVPFAKYFSSAKSNSPDHTARTLSGATETGHSHDNHKSPATGSHLDKLYPELRGEDHIAITQTYTVHSDESSRHDSVV